MNDIEINILNAVKVALLLGGIGALIGVVLAFASNVFKVETDPRYDKILKALPGANCGACGFPGCSGMANGIIEGKADVAKCVPGTELTRAKVRAILAGEDPDKVVVNAQPKKA